VTLIEDVENDEYDGKWKGNTMKNKKTMVSIVIPVYQAEDYLIKCMESILNQTYGSYEIILVDDGSSDGSVKICDKYAEKYHNIYCIHQKNKGVSSARNLGIDKALGKYIIFVDSDDYIKEDYLENAVISLEHGTSDMYLCGYQPVRKNGVIKEKEHIPMLEEGNRNIIDVEKNIIQLFYSNILHAIGTKVYRKDIIDKYNIRFKENWKYYEDIYFCLNYLQYCNKIYVHRDIMYYYQIDISNSLLKQVDSNRYESVYRTYHLLAKLMHSGKVGYREKEIFYKTYFDTVNKLLNAKVLYEKNYNINVSRMYKRLSKDRIYNRSLIYAGKYEKIEFLCVMKKQYFGAYFIRKFGCRSLEKDNLGSADKNRTLFLMMNQWVKVKQVGKNLSSYFIQKGYKKIAIYGIGYAGETLIDELKESGIIVAYCIDQRAGMICADVDVVSLNDYLERVDVVVVTAITFFDDIKEKLSKKLDCPIISLEDILYEV